MIALTKSTHLDEQFDFLKQTATTGSSGMRCFHFDLQTSCKFTDSKSSIRPVNWIHTAVHASLGDNNLITAEQEPARK